jgi:hypothetical protein
MGALTSFLESVKEQLKITSDAKTITTKITTAIMEDIKIDTAQNFSKISIREVQFIAICNEPKHKKKKKPAAISNPDLDNQFFISLITLS